MWKNEMIIYENDEIQNEYKLKCIKETLTMLEITFDECCNRCKDCKESNDCKLTKIKDGLANLYGNDCTEGSELNGN